MHACTHLPCSCRSRLACRMSRVACRAHTEYVACARGRFLSVAWACREQNRAMNACLSMHTNADSLDAFKVAYVQEKRSKAAAAAAAGAGAAAASPVAPGPPTAPQKA